jgi:hypothetical protein
MKDMWTEEMDVNLKYVKIMKVDVDQWNRNHQYALQLQNVLHVGIAIIRVGLCGFIGFLKNISVTRLVSSRNRFMSLSPIDIRNGLYFSEFRINLCKVYRCSLDILKF